MAYVATGYFQEGYVAEGIYIDWEARIIHVPKDYMLLTQTNPTEIRELDLDTFRRDLKALEDDPDGMTFPDTHRHNTIVLLGGVTYARTIEIINGYTVTFEDGQYAVNLVGANSNVGDVVNVNQVSVRSANSAGLTYSKEVEDQSFLDGRVWIDIVRGSSGTQFPKGTPSYPVNTYEDAESIVAQRNLPHRFHLKGVLNLLSNANLTDDNWLGADPVTSKMVFDGTQTCGATTFRKLHLIGAINGTFTMQDGILQNMSNFQSDATNTGFIGTLTLPPSGSLNPFYSFIQCFSLVPGTGTPVIDCNNHPNLMMQFREYTGGLEIRNYTDANNEMSIDLLSGHVTIDSSCTAGTIVVRGAGYITDNSNGAVNIVNLGLVTTRSDKLLSKKDFIALK